MYDDESYVGKLIDYLSEHNKMCGEECALLPLELEYCRFYVFCIHTPQKKVEDIVIDSCVYRISYISKADGLLCEKWLKDIVKRASFNGNLRIVSKEDQEYIKRFFYIVYFKANSFEKKRLDCQLNDSGVNGSKELINSLNIFFRLNNYKPTCEWRDLGHINVLNYLSLYKSSTFRAMKYILHVKHKVYHQKRVQLMFNIRKELSGVKQKLKKQLEARGFTHISYINSLDSSSGSVILTAEYEGNRYFVKGYEPSFLHTIGQEKKVAAVLNNNEWFFKDKGFFDERVIVFDYVDYDDIGARFQELNKYTFTKVFVDQMVYILDYLREKGIVHRDIRESNIMCYQEKNDSNAKFKLIDFGLACINNKDSVSQDSKYNRIAIQNLGTTGLRVWDDAASTLFLLDNMLGDDFGEMEDVLRPLFDRTRKTVVFRD